MRNPSVCFCVVTCLFAGAMVRGQASGPAAAPTVEEIQKMIDAEGYRPALRAIAQIMPSNTSKSNVDKYTLLMMRGECLLQLKDRSTALIAYDQAGAAANSLQQNEAARAMAILIRASTGVVYTPRTGDRTPLDLLKPVTRKQAMAAMLADELPGVSNKVNQALNAGTLPPIMALGATLRDLHALEQVATGEDKTTMGFVRPLGDQVYAMVEAELSRTKEQVQSIQRASARNVSYGGGSFQSGPNGVAFVPDNGATGLSGDNRQLLRDSITYLNNIGQTCEDLGAMARRYDGDVQRWQNLSKETRGVIDFATAVYDHE